MLLFRRALRWFFFLVGVIAGVAGSAALYFARLMVNPPRQRLWATPADLGLDFQDAEFATTDGVRLSGWFIPAGSKSPQQGATIVLVHGWPWNRLGAAAEDMFSSLTGATPVDLLRLAFGLHQDGYHVLMFDLRNHGQSESATPVTFGWKEANDLLAALHYLAERDDVDSQRTGVVGFSTGANALLFALPQTNQITAAIAVQPVTVSHFAGRFGADLIGPLAKLAIPLAELIYRAAGGPPLAAIKPGFAAAGAGQTPILMVQAQDDRWGSPQDVAQMEAAAPGARPTLYVEDGDRFSGYQYVVDNPRVVTAFFDQHLATAP